MFIKLFLYIVNKVILRAIKYNLEIIKEQFLASLELKQDISVYEKEYPFILEAVKNLSKIDFHKHVTFLVWENGSGKSTLLEALAIHMWFNAEWWSQNFNFHTEKTHSKLYSALRVAKWIKKAKDWYFLRAESFYNVASNIDQLDREDSFGPPLIDSYGWKSLHEQSHWESFFSLFTQRLKGNGLYIFDEPEAALSPERQLSFLVQLHELVQKNSQFVIATHSPILLSYPNAKVIEIDSSWYNEISYKDTKTYSVYNSFFWNSDGMIKKLWIEKM